MALIEKAYNDNLPFILIAEDDFTLPDEAQAADRFRNIFEQLPEDWYCLKFGTASGGLEDKNWYRCSDDLMNNIVRGCFFYMLSRNAIADCIADKEHAIGTTDEFIYGWLMQRKREKCYLVHPMLAHVSERFETTRTQDPPSSLGLAAEYIDNCKNLDSYLWTFYRHKKTPWALNDAAFEKIIELIKDGKKKVVEFGAGWSTTAFRRAGAKILSFEEDDDFWIPDSEGSSVVVVHKRPKNGWYNRKVVDRVFENYFDYWRQIDIMIIDGPYGKKGDRTGVLDFIDANIERFRRSQTWIVVDDTNRPKDMAIAKKIRKYGIQDEIVLGDGTRTTHFLKIADIKKKVTASMAAMPEREQLLEKTVASLLPQIDKLNIYLNEWDNVPDFLNHEKINAIRSQDAKGDLGAAGKFFWSREVRGIHLTVDDDIIYPPDYVHQMVECIEKYKGYAISFHGSKMLEEKKFRRREVHHFHRQIDNDIDVDFIGTGVAGYDSDIVTIVPDDFLSNNWADGWFAIAARKRRIPLKVMAHEGSWIEAQKVTGRNIWAENRKEKNEKQINAWLEEHW